MTEAVKPFDGQRGLERKQLAKYLNRVGRGVNCRLDVPVLVLEDIKWAATIFEKLAKELTEIAFEDDRPDIWRILAARYAMEGAKSELYQRNERKQAIRLAKEAEKASKPGN